MKNKSDLRVIKTKNTLYDALLQLMKDTPLEDIKVSDICEKALINRSTFYAHFADKYELLQSYIEYLYNELNDEIEKEEDIKTTKEYYIKLITKFLNHIDLNKEKYLSILINSKNSIAMDMMYNLVLDSVSKNMKDINNKDIPIDILSKFCLGAVFCVAVEWLNSSSKYTKEEIIKYLEKLLPNY